MSAEIVVRLRLSGESPRKGLMSRVRAYLSECLVSAAWKRQLEIPIHPLPLSNSDPLQFLSGTGRLEPLPLIGATTDGAARCRIRTCACRRSILLNIEPRSGRAFVGVQANCWKGSALASDHLCSGGASISRAHAVLADEFSVLNHRSFKTHVVIENIYIPEVRANRCPHNIIPRARIASIGVDGKEPVCVRRILPIHSSAPGLL